MKYRRILLFLAILSSAPVLFSQSGGDNTYDFLNLTNSARVAAIGGQNISLNDNDLNLVFHNPSLLNKEMNKQLVLNYINYFAGVNFGYVSYAMNNGTKHTLAAGLHYIYYGEFVEADATGRKLGKFRAADYALNLFYSRPLIDSLLHVGVNVKPIYSDLENYTSFGLAADLGLTYHNPGTDFTAALVFKNAGLQLKKYHPNQAREALPFEIQLGISKRLSHAPFRVSLTAHQLQQWDLSYQTETELEEDLNRIALGDAPGETPLADFADNSLRHLIFGVEFIPSDKFFVQLGFNYKRRQEMAIKEKPGTVGFSWGFGLKIKKFRVNYGRSAYHLARGTNHFSLSTNLSSFKPKL